MAQLRLDGKLPTPPPPAPRPPQQQAQQGSNGVPQASSPPKGTQSGQVGSPNSEGAGPGDAEFAAIWGSQMGKLADEEDEEAGAAMPSFQPASFQMQGGFQAAPEELFWASGKPQGGAPHFPMPPNGTQPQEQQELFWGGAGDTGDQVSGAQWGGLPGSGGGIFSGGIPGAQSLPGGSRLQQGAGGWNMGGTTSHGNGSFPIDTTNEPDTGFKAELEAGTAGSPSEYQSHHLVGDSLSALLDDD